MNRAPTPEPLSIAVTWYSQAARLRTSSFLAPPLNEAGFNMHFGGTPPPLLDTLFVDSAHLVTSLQNRL